MTTRHLSAGSASLVVHAILFAILAWLPWGAAPRTAVIGYASAIFAAPSADVAGSGAAVSGAGPAVEGASAGQEQEGEPSGGEVSSEFNIPGFSFDFRKVAARAMSLFPFLTHPPEFGGVFSASRQSGTGLPFVTPAVPARNRSSKRPLSMSDTAMQQAIDSTWARRDRWTAFQPIARLVESHHPDAGRLPELLKAYLDQNLLQPYVDTTIRDPRLWTMLGVAADSQDFIAFIETYVKEHAGTRAATELLFLLDELAQGNHDALVALVDTNADRDLWWTRYTSRDAFDLALRIQRHYRTLLAQRGLTTGIGLRAYYDQVRLEYLGAILGATPAGYRASDARFLIGSIYWKRGRHADAVRAWRQMHVVPGDLYVAACGDILDLLNAGADPAGDRVAGARVDGILAAEHQRWLRYSEARLRQFGYAPDAF